MKIPPMLRWIGISIIAAFNIMCMASILSIAAFFSFPMHPPCGYLIPIGVIIAITSVMLIGEIRAGRVRIKKLTFAIGSSFLAFAIVLPFYGITNPQMLLPIVLTVAFIGIVIILLSAHTCT